MISNVPKPALHSEQQIRRIGIVMYPGLEVLNVTGPHEVFSFANKFLKEQGITQERMYSVTLLAEQPGPVTTLSGLQVIAEQSYLQTDENYTPAPLAHRLRRLPGPGHPDRETLRRPAGAG